MARKRFINGLKPTSSNVDPYMARLDEIDRNTTIIDSRNSSKASKNSRPLGF